MKENTILLLKTDKYIGLLNEKEPNIFVTLNEDGTLGGTIDITNMSYSVISTHENIMDLTTAIELLV